MREFSNELAAELASGASHFCRCWLVVRADGQRMGFTDHDRDLRFGGDTFLAETGLTGSAVETATGLAVDNAQAFGALSAAGLREEDILAGRYDRAEVRLYLVDWQVPENRILQFKGRLGEIERGAVAFEAELRGLADDLNQPMGRAYVPNCDASLGDVRCGVALEAPYVLARTLLRQDGPRRLIVAATGLEPGWFSRGYAEWQSGTLAGLRSLIRDDRPHEDGHVLELWDDATLTPAPGDGLRLIAGCDKRAETCRTKFANLLNFRGFPHIPGEDWVTAVPDDKTVHDGGKLLNGR